MYGTRPFYFFLNTKQNTNDFVIKIICDEKLHTHNPQLKRKHWFDCVRNPALSNTQRIGTLNIYSQYLWLWIENDNVIFILKLSFFLIFTPRWLHAINTAIAGLFYYLFIYFFWVEGTYTQTFGLKTQIKIQTNNKTPVLCDGTSHCKNNNKKKFI